MGLSGSESLPHCEKEVGEPTSEAGGVGSSFFTSVTLSTSMATRSLRDSEKRGDRKMSGAVSGPEVKATAASFRFPPHRTGQQNIEGLEETTEKGKNFNHSLFFCAAILRARFSCLSFWLVCCR